MEHLNLIQKLTQETIDFYQYLDDYQIDIDEELVLLSIKNKQELIDELNALSFKDYCEVMNYVFDDAYNAIYEYE